MSKNTSTTSEYRMQLKLLQFVDRIRKSRTDNSRYRHLTNLGKFKHRTKTLEDSPSLPDLDDL